MKSFPDEKFGIVEPIAIDTKISARMVNIWTNHVWS